MIRARLLGISIKCLLAIAPGAVIATGCAAAPDHGGEHLATGKLNMPLVTESNGHTYRLSGYLYYSGPEFGTISFNDGSELNATLSTGNYYAYLGSYALERLDDNGNYQPVQATLVSSYYQQFTIYNLTTTTIQFQFQTDGLIVTVGSGNLHVDIDVMETPPTCTILGNDCPGGLWCAPPGLTGQPLACIGAGGTPLGEACNSPADCVANTSCFDLGAGPVCAALCDASEFGSDCSTGGSCEKARSDYGICVPAGGTFPGGGGNGEAGAPGAGG